MIDVDCTLYFTVFVNHLILIGYAADTIGPFPSRCQLGGAFWRGGESEE